MKLILPLLFLALHTVSFSQLRIVKKLDTERKNETPVSFATIFQNKYLYNKHTYTADGKATNELWITDGTEPGTTLLTNSPGDFLAGGRVGNNYIFFKSNYAADGNTLIYDCWKTDGTVNGTILMKAALVSGIGNDGSYYTKRPRSFAAVNDQLYFVTDGGTEQQRLWKTNGTARYRENRFCRIELFQGVERSYCVQQPIVFSCKRS